MKNNFMLSIILLSIHDLFKLRPYYETWIQTTFLMSPNVPRVKPRSSGWCDEEEFPIFCVFYVFYALAHLNFLRILNYENLFTLITMSNRMNLSLIFSHKIIEQISLLSQYISFSINLKVQKWEINIWFKITRIVNDLRLSNAIWSTPKLNID